MPAHWYYALLSVSFVSIFSLFGIIILLFTEQKLQKVIFFLVSLSVGTLFGDAFIHLLPESFKRAESSLETPLFTLMGIFIFFILEKFIRWRHEHTVHFDSSIHPLGHMNLVADGIHNFIDGIIIGAAYVTSLQLGIATTIAVLLHEIPQEITDFGVLLYAGFSKGKALFFNFISASSAILGTIIALYIGTKIEGFSDIMVPITAGGFIYIAGSDLLPELHKELRPSKSLLQFISMLTGVFLMFTLLFFE